MSRKPSSSSTPSKSKLKFRPNFVSPARTAAPTTTAAGVVLQAAFQRPKSDGDSVRSFEIDYTPTTILPDDRTSTMNNDSNTTLGAEPSRTLADSLADTSGFLVSRPSSPAVKPIPAPDFDIYAPRRTPSTNSSRSSSPSRRSTTASTHDVSLATDSTSLPPSTIGAIKPHSRSPSECSISASAPVLVEPVIVNSYYGNLIPAEPANIPLPPDELEAEPPISYPENNNSKSSEHAESALATDEPEVPVGLPEISATQTNPTVPEAEVSKPEIDVHDISKSFSLAPTVGEMESRSRYPSFSFNPGQASTPPLVSTNPSTATNSVAATPYLKPAVSTSSVSLMNPQATLSPRDASEPLDPRSPLNVSQTDIVYDQRFPHPSPTGAQVQTIPLVVPPPLSNSAPVVPESEPIVPDKGPEIRIDATPELEKQPKLENLPEPTSKSIYMVDDFSRSVDLAASATTVVLASPSSSWAVASRPSFPFPSPKPTTKDEKQPKLPDNEEEDHSGHDSSHDSSHDYSHIPSKSSDSEKHPDWSIEVMPTTPKSEHDETEVVPAVVPPTTEATVVDVVAPAPPDVTSNPNVSREPLPTFSNHSESEPSSSNQGSVSKASDIASKMPVPEVVPPPVDIETPVVVEQPKPVQPIPFTFPASSTGQLFRVGSAPQNQPIKPRPHRKQDSRGSRDMHALLKSKHAGALDLIELDTLRGQISVVLSWMHDGGFPSVNLSAGLAHLHGDEYAPGVKFQLSKSRVAKCTSVGDVVTRTYTLEMIGTTSSVPWTAGMLSVAILVAITYAFLWGWL